MKRSRFLGGIYLGKIIYYKQQETAAITDQILDPAWAEPQLQLPALHHWSDQGERFLTKHPLGRDWHGAGYWRHMIHMILWWTIFEAYHDFVYFVSLHSHAAEACDSGCRLRPCQIQTWKWKVKLHQDVKAPISLIWSISYQLGTLAWGICPNNRESTGSSKPTAAVELPPPVSHTLAPWESPRWVPPGRSSTRSHTSNTHTPRKENCPEPRPELTNQSSDSFWNRWVVEIPDPLTADPADSSHVVGKPLKSCTSTVRASSSSKSSREGT